MIIAVDCNISSKKIKRKIETNNGKCFVLNVKQNKFKVQKFKVQKPATSIQ